MIVKFAYSPNATGLTARLILNDSIVGSDRTVTANSVTGMQEFTVNEAVGTYEVVILQSTVKVVTGLVLKITSTEATIYDGLGQLSIINSIININLNPTINPTINVTLDSTLAINQNKVQIKPINIFNNSPMTLTIILDEGVFDGTTMRFVIENSNKVDLAVVEDLTSSTNTITFTVPAFTPPSKGNGTWSLRQSNNNKVRTSGTVKFLYAAIKDI
jgi:hypothetical protein